jgi:hypothetical protein
MIEEDVWRAFHVIEWWFPDCSCEPEPPPWRWRKVPFGPCPRCYWPAHTLGPNGQPWHAFCWGNPDPPTWWDRFLLRESRKDQEE